MSSSANPSRPSLPEPFPKQSLLRAAAGWWKDQAAGAGGLRASRVLVTALWEFARDSTPERRKARFGDAEYDWEHRVNTTSGAVGWRDRLLGVFHSPYQPTEAGLFHEMIGALVEHTQIDLREFTFVDLGSGKGRTLLMAADYPFRRVEGVELLSSLHQIAVSNIGAYSAESQRCFTLQSICADATEFLFPDEPLVVFLFNPFPEAGLRRVVANLEQSLKAHPRAVYVIYHNPVLAEVFSDGAAFSRIGGTHQYAIYAATIRVP
jgi:hypothetical protein